MTYSNETVRVLNALELEHAEIEKMRATFRDFAERNLSTKESARQVLIASGIYQSSGQLSPLYGGPGTSGIDKNDTPSNRVSRLQRRAG